MDNYILQHTIGPLTLTGVQGTVTTTPRALYGQGMEFSPWQRDLGATFYTGFHRQPPVYILADRTREANTTIVTIGLDAKVSKDILRQIAGAFGLCARTADNDFHRRLTSDLSSLEEMKVEEFTDLSRRAEISLDRAFGMIRYCNFLTMQLGMNRDDAMRRAMEEYGKK